MSRAFRVLCFIPHPQPINDISQSLDDWKNALFADTVSFNYPVVSKYEDFESVRPNKATSNQQLATDLSESMSASSVTDESIGNANRNNTLIGYINITICESTAFTLVS